MVYLESCWDPCEVSSFVVDLFSNYMNSTCTFWELLVKKENKNQKAVYYLKTVCIKCHITPNLSGHCGDSGSSSGQSCNMFSNKINPKVAADKLIINFILSILFLVSHHQTPADLFLFKLEFFFFFESLM